MRLQRAVGVVLAAVVATPLLAATPAELFSARPAAYRVHLSPDGEKIVYTTAYKTRGRAIMVADLVTGDATMVLASATVDVTPLGCSFKTATRLICTLYGVLPLGKSTFNFTRVLAVDVDGKNVKILSQRATSQTLAAFSGGGVLDWLPDDPDHVIMQTYVGEANGGEDYSGGTLIKAKEPGVGAALVDIHSGRQTTVERSSTVAGGYGSDNRGNIRFRALIDHDATGYVRDGTSYAVRAKGRRDWIPLARANLSDQRATEYAGFDDSGDFIYQLKDLDGRKALYRVATDGSNANTLVFAQPRVDVDGVLRIGKYRRPVGAEFTLERDEVHFFDPALVTLSASLTRALPGHPDVSVVDESWDGMKKLIYVDGDSRPGRYFRYDTLTHKLGELAPVYPGLDGVALGTVKAVRYPAADGTMIPGYLTLPPGKDDARGLPAIIMPHGGPSARDSAGFDWLSQFFAAEGFAVLRPNYRGSSGYGADFFANNGFQSWALAMGDINSGARWLAAQGIADPHKLAIVGWSYGGYAALQANVVDPGLYRATVAVAPVTDLELLRTEAMDQSDFKQVDAMIGRGPHVTAGSPDRNAAKIMTPVLMFHADRDLNVEIEQSRVMASALRAAGKKVELVEYKGLDHQLDDTEVRRDLLTRSAAFLKAALN